MHGESTLIKYIGSVILLLPYAKQLGGLILRNSIIWATEWYDFGINAAVPWDVCFTLVKESLTPVN